VGADPATELAGWLAAALTLGWTGMGTGALGTAPAIDEAAAEGWGSILAGADAVWT
jgi:hypothetical protein